ncbi:MAG: hypothetical protein ACYCY7_00830 [Gallionella sp.]
MTSQLLTVKQFSDKHPAFTHGSLRALIFASATRTTSKGAITGNGLAPAIVRIGAKILIDETAFFAWVREQQVAA